MAEDPIAECRAAIEEAKGSSAWRSHDGETPSYVVALAPGTDVDPWQPDPEDGDASVLPIPGLFTNAAKVAGYAATRGEDPVLQLRLMLDAIGHDGRLRIDPKAMVRLCAAGNAMLADVGGFGLPSEPARHGRGEWASATGSPGTG